MKGNDVKVGCAAWALPKEHKHLFPADGPHLSRYAAVFNAVEINSSFYKHHRERTYARWATEVPGDFRFAVKMSKEITHETRLRLPPLLDEFLPGPLQLGDKLGAILVQLPPSFALDIHLADAFFDELRVRFDGPVVCEPRHASWFTGDGDDLLAGYRIGRVAADPAPAPGAAHPGGYRGISYYRLHGSPRMYYSSYEDDYLGDMAELLLHEEGDVWCLFDNTARNAAIPNALHLLEHLEREWGIE